MSTPKNGGPAFPLPSVNLGGQMEWGHDGMSLRDWFAGQALSGAAAFCADESGTREDDVDLMVQTAYALADAMLAEREKGQP